MPPPRTNRSKPRRARPRRIGIFLLFCAFCGGLLYWTGLPAPLANALLRHYLPPSVLAECDSLLHRPGSGFHFRGLRVYSPHDHVTPLLHATELRLNPAWAKRLRRGVWTGSLALVDARLQTDLGLWANDLVTRQPLQLEQLNLRLHLDETSLKIEHGSAQFFGLRLNAEGVVPLQGWPSRQIPSPPRADSLALLPQLAALAAPQVALVERFTFNTPPDLWVRFSETGEVGNPLRVDLSLAHRTRSNLRGAELQRIEIKAHADVRSARIETLEVEDPDGRILWVAGAADLVNNTAQVDIRNSLPRYALEALCPVALSRILAHLAIRVEGLSDFDLRFGPSSFDTFGDDLSGRLHLTDAFYRDAHFPELEMDIRYAKRQLRIDSLRGQVGTRSARGPFEGRLFTDLETGQLEIEAKGSFKPEAVISLMGPRAEKLVREWECNGPPPQMTFQLWQASASAPLRLELLLSAKEVLSHGALFSTIDLHVRLDENQMVIDDLVITRGQELLQGRIAANPEFSKLDLDIRSSLHLPVVAAILGGSVVDFLEPFRFRGSNQIHIQGLLDTTAAQQHRLSGSVNLNDFVWKWAKIDNISTPFTLQDGSLVLPEIRATLTGGGMNGRFATENLFEPAGRFNLALDIRDADLFRIITAATDSTDTPYTGRLTLNLDLQGALRGQNNQPAFASYTGKGAIRIQEGTLFRIPLLLGLSRILGKVVSGFGYASQTDFSADFTLDAGTLRSDNLLLAGRILSIAGEGRYNMDRSLRGNVRVHLLNEGILSDALRVLLWPIRKLIEIQLTGTLDEPDWQPRNLPKELFGK